jgi:hypothetical protein
VGSKLRLIHLDGPFQSQPGDLFVYLDETGDESMADPNRTMFGFGGVAVMASNYFRVLADPWRAVKREQFGSEDTRLHAATSDLRKAAPAIGDFFKTQGFYRIAAVATPTTMLNNVEGVHDGVCYAIQAQVGRIVEATNPSRVVFFFEESARGNELVMKNFGPLRMARVHPNGRRELIPVVICFTPKAAGAPALEVADFVAHAAGCQASNHERGDGGWRKDFAAVFQESPQGLADFAHIREMGRVREPLLPGREPGATYLDIGVESLGRTEERDPPGTPHRPAKDRKR